MKYKFYLEGAEVHPVYGDDLSLTYKREDGRIYFRKELGELKFRNYKTWTDYDTIMAYDNDREINLVVRRDCDNYVADWWVGYFGRFDGDVDEDNCTFTVTPTVDDEYTCLKHKGDEEWNILNVPSASNVDIDFSYYEFITCTDETVELYSPHTANTYGYTDDGAGNYTFYDTAGPVDKPYGADIADGIPITAVAPNWNRSACAANCLPDRGDPVGSKDRGFVAYKQSIEEALDVSGSGSPQDFRITTIWFREVIWTIDVDGNATVPNTTLYGTGWDGGGGGDHVGAETIDGIRLHKWARRPEDNAGAAPQAWDASAAHQGDSIWPKVWIYDAALPDFSDEVEQCRPIKNVIDYMLNQMSCGLTYRSTFFDNSVLPPEAPADIDTIITASSGDNYVTEEANLLNYLMIAQKSDVIACISSPGAGCSSSEDATKGMISFNGLMEILYKMFQVYWYVDSEGFFRIEHERFFSKELGSIDLTTLLNKYSGELWEKGTRKYKYITGELYGKERWEFMEQNYPDFLGETIDYDEILSNTRIELEVKDYNVSMVTTDMMMIYHVENTGYLEGPISTDGFCILQCSYDGSYTCDNETGALSGVSLPNNHLSVANLQDKYWRWNRIQERGVMNQDHYNATETTFESWIRNKEQIEVSFHQCCDAFDELDLILTSLGSGEVVGAVHKLTSGMMKVKLRYL